MALLIYVKDGDSPFRNVVAMNSAREMPRTCPVCRIAMQAQRIEGGVQHACERCGLTITFAPAAGRVSSFKNEEAAIPAVCRFSSDLGRSRA
jgi:ribosomal protein L37AE/L43A